MGLDWMPTGCKHGILFCVPKEDGPQTEICNPPMTLPHAQRQFSHSLERRDLFALRRHLAATSKAYL